MAAAVLGLFKAVRKSRSAKVVGALVILNEIRGVLVVTGVLWGWFG